MIIFRIVRPAVLVASLAVLLSGAHWAAEPGFASTQDQASVPALSEHTETMQSRMTGKRLRVAKPVRRKTRTAVRKRVLRKNAATQVVARTCPQRGRKNCGSTTAAELDHVGSYNFKVEISSSPPATHNRGDYSDHMGAYNFTVDVE